MGISVVVLGATLLAPSRADAEELRVRVSLRAQPLGAALIEFSRQTGQQILYAPAIVTGHRSRAVSGGYTHLEALRRLLEGTGLEVRRTRSGVLIISAAAKGKQAKQPAPRPRLKERIPPIQPVPPTEAQESIIVTARRREEVLEHVPQTVNVVTAEQLRSLAFNSFEEVAGVVAGLSLSSGSSGTSNTASMRGVTFATETAATPTVEFYFNDTPVSSSFLFQPLFDVGQLEVLRGPQGTLRGRAAPSGAVTLTTKQPDLGQAGGYAGLSVTARGGINIQAAAGIPLVRDVLAIRLAGVVDDGDYDGVTSLSSAAAPRQRSWGLRGTLRFDPTDDLSTTVMAQHVDNMIHSFAHLAGPGSPGIAPRDTGYALPAAIYFGYNGPPLSPGDRKGVSENQRRTFEAQTIATALATWRFGGQKLAYAASFARSDRRSLVPADDVDLLAGYDRDLTTTTRSTYWTHELKLESEIRVAGALKYIVGAFHTQRSTDVLSERGPAFGLGAFGSSLGAPSITGAVLERYSIGTMISRLRDEAETSIFGNVTWALDERTEFAAGIRYIIARRNNLTRILRSAGSYRLEPASSPDCDGLPASAAYAGFCDVAIAPGELGSASAEVGTHRPVIYSLQLSHRFGEALMIYGNFGTSWREGPGIIGITNGGIGTDGGPGEPALRALANASPERSRSIEVGFKAGFFDKRLQFNAAFYHQTFDGLIYRGLPTAYLIDNGFSPPSVGRFSFTSNVGARADGVDVELSLRASPRWSLSAGFSYAHGRVTDDLIPCNDGDFDGVPDDILPTAADFQAAGRRVSLCRSNRSVTRSPRWSMILQSEYRRPISPRASAYGRALLNHFPRNGNDNEAVAIRSYTTLNLYAGLTSVSGWDVSLFVKNALGAGRLVSREAMASRSESNLGAYFGASGYHSVRVVPPRQVGLNLRYAFGSS